MKSVIVAISILLICLLGLKWKAHSPQELKGASNGQTWLSSQISPRDSARDPEQERPAESLVSRKQDQRPIHDIEDITAKIAKAEEMNDAESTGWLVETLSNSEPVLRHEALQALVRMERRDAAPGIRNAAQYLSDSEEKQSLLEAADWLELDSVSELHAQEAQKPRNTKSPVQKPVRVNKHFRMQAVAR